ncbi:MAG: hypothetical protein ACJ74Q_06260 [Pyrinomonadaceae bacterium]
MGWEGTKKNAVGVYYVRKVREGRRVRSVYVGAGSRGEQAALEDAERRASERDARRARRRPAPAVTVSIPPAEVVSEPVFSAPEASKSLSRVSFSVAVAQIEAARALGGDVAAMVEAVNVDGVTRSLLRYKFLSARRLTQM